MSDIIDQDSLYDGLSEYIFIFVIVYLVPTILAIKHVASLFWSCKKALKKFALLR